LTYTVILIDNCGQTIGKVAMSTTQIKNDYFVAGELAMLIFSYLNDARIDAPALRRRLMNYGRGSQMPITTWWQALSDMQRIKPDPYLGFAIGQHIQLFHSGVLGYQIAQSETLGDALISFQNFQSLLHNFGSVNIDHSDGRVNINWDYQGKKSTLLSDQIFAGSMLTIVRQITGNPKLAANEMRFQQAAPDSSSPPLTIPIRYQSPALGISFPAQFLQLPIATVDPFLLSIIDRQAIALKSTKQDRFLQLVENRIIAALSSGKPSAEAVASDLNLSRRTLHRHLKQHSLNFHGLLRQIRIKLADLYLSEPHLGLTDVAFLLGYSEQSAFSRAFRGWHKATPDVYRRQL
jgi:AraC-like DNA-binding protein